MLVNNSKQGLIGVFQIKTVLLIIKKSSKVFNTHLFRFSIKIQLAGWIKIFFLSAMKITNFNVTLKNTHLHLRTTSALSVCGTGWSRFQKDLLAQSCSKQMKYVFQPLYLLFLVFFFLYVSQAGDVLVLQDLCLLLRFKQSVGHHGLCHRSDGDGHGSGADGGDGAEELPGEPLTRSALLPVYQQNPRSVNG